MAFRYILRYYIDPGFHEDDRIGELVEFCRRSRTEEVMLFYNPEELFQGYPGRQEQENWLLLAIKVKVALNSHGIAMSVNPWTTIVHLSRGRKFGQEQQKMQPMVGENGYVSPITACPLDPEWQCRLGDWFAEIARRVAPTAIWVEDDWRLHNHEPEMNFGGCCCPLHLQRFSQQVGREVGREELLVNMLAPGEPHPWRQIWLDLWRDTMVEPARHLERQVHAANPDVELALMSSVPDVHSAEGRDWSALAHAFSPDRPLLLRPHLPPYTETSAMTALPSVTRQTIAYAPPGTLIYPELENSPRCGRYSKSAKFSIWECWHSALFGSRGITINHFDMMGNGIALDTDFDVVLAAAKPRLDAIAALNLDDRNADGIDILASPDQARYLISAQPDSFNGLVQRSHGWSDTLYMLGISHRFITKADTERVTAVSGPTLNALSNEELQRLLSGWVLLDACSAEIIINRGLGHLIGIKSAAWHSLNDLGYAYEEINEADPAIYGLAKPRMSAQRCSQRLWRMEINEDAKAWTTICSYDRQPLCPGLAEFTNALGGIVRTLAYPLGEGQFFVGFFNNFRRILWQRFLETSAQPLAMGRQGPLQVYRVRHAQGVLLAILNPSHDDLKTVEFFASEVNFDTAQGLATDGTWQAVELQKIAANIARYPQPLEALEVLILNFPSLNDQEY